MYFVGYCLGFVREYGMCNDVGWVVFLLCKWVVGFRNGWLNFLVDVIGNFIGMRGFLFFYFNENLLIDVECLVCVYCIFVWRR